MLLRALGLPGGSQVSIESREKADQEAPTPSPFANRALAFHLFYIILSITFPAIKTFCRFRKTFLEPQTQHSTSHVTEGEPKPREDWFVPGPAAC